MSSEPESTVPPAPPQEGIRGTLAEVLQAASDPALTEDLALALLKRSDLPREVLEQLSKNSGVMKGRKLKLALVTHGKTPRHVSLPVVRQLFTFELMQVALSAVAPGDIKKAAEEALLHRLETISLGERISLGRRASSGVAAALLLDPEPRVIHAALENSRLTEASVIRALTRRAAPAAFVHAVCHHPQWSLRRDVRVTLLRNQNTPLARALEFARALPPAVVREVLQGSALPERIKSHLLQEIAGNRRESRRSDRKAVDATALDRR